jgi:hypothetical protein
MSRPVVASASGAYVSNAVLEKSTVTTFVCAPPGCPAARSRSVLLCVVRERAGAPMTAATSSSFAALRATRTILKPARAS